MNKLHVFVCDNISVKFQQAVEQEGLDDVQIVSFPCLCEKTENKNIAASLLHKSLEAGDQGMVLCGKNCDILNCIPAGAYFEIRLLNFCFNHLASDELVKYFLRKGGYIIGLGWLNNWLEHITASGFDRNSARQFYHGFCKELVYFDASSDAAAEDKLQALAEFLDLPYVIMHMELEAIEAHIHFIIHHWHTLKKNHQQAAILAEAQAQCAEYSAILELIGKISADTNKRDAIEKIKEIFVMVFGTRQFKYWNSDYEAGGLPEEIREMLMDRDKPWLFFPEENRVCIKIEQNGKSYGVIDVGGFLFPQYTEKYLNFAIEIGKICGLVLSNIEQYEILMRSEQELQYLNFHDPLTGLYNRAFLAEWFQMDHHHKTAAVFLVGIDQLKAVNYSYGHLEGDKLICTVANIFKNNFRETDTVARIGGDEFIAVLPNCTMPMAETFKHRIDETVAVHNQNNPQAQAEICISLGFILSKNKKETVEELIKKASQSMLAERAKKTAERNDPEDAPSPMVSVVLVDDEIPALEELQYQLSSFPEINVLGSFTNPAAAFKKITESHPDVVFLDIDMPGENGIEIAEKIYKLSSKIKIVFVTAYQKYAVQAFEVHALDYLLKPIMHEQFIKTMTRIIAGPQERRSQTTSQDKIYIKCFGQFSITKTGRTKEVFKWRTNKSKELFLFLLLHHGRSVAKDELISILFDGVDLKKAYNNLYVSMYYLRKSIEEFGIDRSMLLIKDDYSVEIRTGICDFIDFLNCRTADPQMPEEMIAEYEAILANYQGAFLEEEDFDWAEAMRGHLSMKYEKTSLLLADICREFTQTNKAENILQRLLNHEPLSEDAYHKLMDLYIAGNLPERFTKIYKQYEQMMKDELSLPPEKKYKKYFLQIVYPSIFKVED